MKDLYGLGGSAVFIRLRYLQNLHLDLDGDVGDIVCHQLLARQHNAFTLSLQAVAPQSAKSY